MSEKPLHVRVAEALGWTYTGTERDTAYGVPPGGKIPLGLGFVGITGAHGLEIPRYDANWSATGPLIERYEIVVLRDIRSHAKTYCWMAVVGAQDDHGYLDKDYPDEGNGKSPLVAVCNLILALSKAGRL